MSRIKILGIPIDQVTFKSTLEHIKSFVHQGRPHQIVTVNPEFVMRAQKDKSFRKVLSEADLAVPDGAGLLWASRVIALKNRLLRNPNSLPILKERVTGTDLVPALTELAESKGWKIYLLGGAPGVAAQAAARLKLTYPHLKIAGAESGPVINESGRPLNQDQKSLFQGVLARIRHAKPKLMFVAFGAPKQDLFIAHYQKELDVPVMIGVGGAFDFISGRINRAPRLLQILWLEWLWRLISEPKRIIRIWTAVVRFPIAILIERSK